MTRSIKTLVDLLRTRAQTHTTRLAFTYLKDAGRPAEPDSWMDRCCRGVGVGLPPRLLPPRSRCIHSIRSRNPFANASSTHEARPDEAT